MAYLDIEDAYLVPGAARGAMTPAAIVTFSALEWSVIALARRDGLGSLRTPGRIARAMGGLFGRGTASRLADPRLEALRRVAVYVWERGYAVPAAEVDRFEAAGFTRAQLRLMVESVTEGEVATLAA